MRPGQNGELIFEGTTEARVASQLLHNLMHKDFLGALGLQGELAQPHIGRLDFLARRIEDLCGTSDTTEYSIDDPAKAALAVEALQVAAIPNNILFPIVPGFLRRDRYMSNHLQDFRAKLPAPPTE